MTPHTFTFILDGLSDKRIRWIRSRYGCKSKSEIGMLIVFLEKISSPAGSIFSLGTLTLPTPDLSKKMNEATERCIKNKNKWIWKQQLQQKFVK